MDAAVVVDYTVKAMTLVLLVSLPPILVAALTGLLVSLFQALTQIQEQTLSFAIKLIAVSLTLLLAMHWLGAEIYNYTLNMLDYLPMLAR